jgi:hypothetical protein
MSTTLKLILATLVLGALLTMPSSEVQAGHHHRDYCPPPPPHTVVLVVCHPCTNCQYEIPVCVPACCEGPPSMCFRRTVVGCGKTIFTWSCGYQVVVRYNHHGYRVVKG